MSLRFCQPNAVLLNNKAGKGNLTVFQEFPINQLV